LLTCFAVILAAAVAAAGPERIVLNRYSEKVFLETDGSAQVSVRVSISGGGAGDSVLLPYASSVWPDSVVCHVPVGAVLPRPEHGRLRALLVLSAPVSSTDTLAFAFLLKGYTTLNAPSDEDFGNYVVKYRMVHSLPDPIGKIDLTIVLPSDFVVNNVLSSTPAVKADTPNLVYSLGKENGQHAVTLTALAVNQGDAVGLSLEVKRRNRSFLFIAALVILAGAYLIGFRDLVIPSHAKESGNGSAL
jgi:hypothetical protein